MTVVPITKKGYEQLSLELDRLKKKDRPAVIQAIAEAREHGDLKENAEYHAARERQSFIEGRILNLESKLGNARVIDVTKMEQDGRVVFGVLVELVNIDTDEVIEYQIVGEDEADICQNKISITAPIARALIGKHVDDIVDVDAPNGTVSYEIVAVNYRM